MKKKKFNCSITGMTCLHLDYTGTECYSKLCENIEILTFSSCRTCKFNNENDDCINPKNTKQNPCTGKLHKRIK